MSTVEVTAEEVSESVTGFDEIAVSKHFDGFDLYMHAEEKPVVMLRALVFVHKRHTSEHDNDKAAYTAAMDLTLKEIYDYFAQDEDVDADDPDTESGKGDLTPATEPDGSPRSVSPPEYSPPSIPL